MIQEPSHDRLSAEPSTNGEPPDGDSLLTAHALGELTAGDRPFVESRLRESPDERHAVEQTARLAKLLRQLSADQPLVECSSELRAAVTAALEGPPQDHDQGHMLPDQGTPLLPTGNGCQLIADVSDRVATDAGQAERPVHLSERFPRRRFWLPLSLAASLLVVCGTIFGLMKVKHSEKVVAQREGLPDAASPIESKSEAIEQIHGLQAELFDESAYELSTIDEVQLRYGDAIPNQPSGNLGGLPVGGAGGMGGFGAGGGPGSAPPQNAPQFGGYAAAPKATIDSVSHQRPKYETKSVEARDRAEQTTRLKPQAYTWNPKSISRDRTSGRAVNGKESHGDSPSEGRANTDMQKFTWLRGELEVGDAKSRGEAGVQYSDEGGKSGGGQRGARLVDAEKAGADLAAAKANLEYRQKAHKQLTDTLASSAAPWRVAEESKRHLAEAQAKVAAAETALATAQGGGGPKAELTKAEADLAAAEVSSLARDKEYQRIKQLADENAVNGNVLQEAEALRVAAKFKEQEARVRLGLLRASAGQPDASIPNSESYPALIENPFLKPTEHPLSTFSIDVDTASYANVRRFLNSHGMPPADAVRIEELINYFQYDYPQPEGETPFSITTDVADCQWNAGHRLLRVGLKGREVPVNERPASNLVFLLDVSGSMSAQNKLPLVKEAMYLLTERLTENDRVSIVVYAGNSGLVLPPTNGTDKATIRQAIGQLAAGGSTNGGQGLQMAYDTAQSNFIKGGTNRVILATDGDFNVGIVDQNDLVRFIEERAKSGVFLSALGFGVGNLKDGTLEKLADKGNGNYAYIDTLAEARRVLVEQLSGTLVTIAKDVKIQIEFNPAQAAEYRLIGYEDRVMPHQDFHDDRKDAGEIGAGHTVTALYEIVPAERAAGPGGEPLKYQRSEALTPAADNGELATIKLRYKEPDGQQSRLLERAITDRRPAQAAASHDMNFAAAVAAFGMLLRDSAYRGDATYTKVLAWAEQGISSDTNGYRSEFLELVRLAREISGKE